MLRLSAVVGSRSVAGGAPNPTQKAVPLRGANTQIAPQTRKGIASVGVAPALACMRAKGGAPRRGCRPPLWAYSASPHDAGRAQSPNVARLLSFVGGLSGAPPVGAGRRPLRYALSAFGPRLACCALWAPYPTKKISPPVEVVTATAYYIVRNVMIL